MKKIIDYPLFHNPVEITNALVTVASQENCDGPEYDLMMEAAEYIRQLEILNDLLTPLAQCGRKALNDHLVSGMVAYFENNHKDLSPEFVKIVEENFWELLA